MKFKFKTVLFSTVLLFTSLSAEIIETSHFCEILNYVEEPETLVLLDIDDTLLIPCQTLGTDVWFTYRLRLHQQKYPSQIALDKALAEWEAVRHLTEIKIVESGSENIVAVMQERGIPIMGLTTQGLALATRTVVQLNSLGIDLSCSAPSSEQYYFLNEHGVLYREGVLFTSGTPKGKALLKFFDLIDLRPKHIVFINDKETHLRDVEEAVESKGIRFTGLRYNYSDARVANFDPELAEIQWKHSSFDHILSDEEAKDLLQSIQPPPKTFSPS